MLTNRKIFLTAPPPLTASTTYTDETACTQQPRLRPGCHLHAVSSSYVIVMHCIGMDGPLTSRLHTPSDPCIVRVHSIVIVTPAAANVSPRLACVGPCDSHMVSDGSYAAFVEIHVLVIVGKWGIRVMFGCGTRSRLRYVVASRGLQSCIGLVQCYVRFTFWDFQFCLAMCQIVSSYSMVLVRCSRWMVQCE